MKNFYTETLARDPRFHSDKLCKDMALLEPATRAAVTRLLALAAAAGHNLRVGETFRSQARQHKVFMAGASKLAKVGCHGYGLAADLQLFVGGKYIGDGAAYGFLPELCAKVGLVSGIDWGAPGQHHSFIDAGHVQRIPVFRQAGLFAGAWYPPEIYDPVHDAQANGHH